MKTKKILRLSLILALIPFLKASADQDLLAIREIRGDKNYFADLLLDNDLMGLSYKQKEGMEEATKSYEEESTVLSADPIFEEFEGKVFVFSSGAGAWSTGLEFTDGLGNFDIKFHDSDGNHIYLAEGRGRFVVDQKVDDTCYILRLEDYETTTPTGTIDYDGVLEKEYMEYPHGLQNQDGTGLNEKYTLYFPHRKRSQMSDQLNQWPFYSPYIDEYESRIFMIVNNEMIYPFLEHIE